jgi:hypothetical protein
MDAVERPEQPDAATDYGPSTGDSGGSDKRKPTHTLRLFRRQLGRDQPAERMTHESDALKRSGLEPTAEPACQPGGRKAPSDPWQVEQVNAAMLRQRLEYRPPPAPRTGKAMHKDNWFAFAGDPILGRRPVDHELPNLHKYQFRSRWHELGHRLPNRPSEAARPARRRRRCSG